MVRAVRINQDIGCFDGRVGVFHARGKKYQHEKRAHDDFHFKSKFSKQRAVIDGAISEINGRDQKKYVDFAGDGELQVYYLRGEVE